MKRLLVLCVGALCYAVGMATILYAVGFLGNVLVPRTIDASSEGSASLAILINSLLLGLFAVQHSLMARPWFKAWWTQFVPAHLERSIYVLFSSLALLLLFWQWRPLGGVVWEVRAPVGLAVLTTLYVCGWLTVLLTTFLINHFDLFGLRQVWLYFRGLPYVATPFVTPGPYRLVRHPLYVGWLTVVWAAPTMTAAHLLFALGTTVYILMAVQWEERDLVGYHGRAYEEYRRQVPMLVPGLSLNPAGRSRAQST